MSDARILAHELVDSLPESQLRGLVEFLRTIVDPTADRRDVEPITGEDRLRMEQCERWFVERGGQGVSMDDVLAEYGLTQSDFPLTK